MTLRGYGGFTVTLYLTRFTVTLYFGVTVTLYLTPELRGVTVTLYLTPKLRHIHRMKQAPTLAIRLSDKASLARTAGRGHAIACPRFIRRR